jgi:hypothetical protein
MHRSGQYSRVVRIIMFVLILLLILIIIRGLAETGIDAIGNMM